jgi:hypothetical protein
MPSDAEIRRRQVTAALSICFPTELLALVNEYGVEKPHVWSTEAAADEPTGVPRCIDNFATCESDKNWYRISSTRSIVDGPYRWRIKTNFHRSTAGWMMFGVSSGTSAAVLALPRRPDAPWTDAISVADVVVRTSSAPCFKNNKSAIMIIINAGRQIDLSYAATTTTDTTAFVDVDCQNRILTVSQVVCGRTVRIPQKLPSEPPIDSWRPCVILSGCVAAAILPWMDDE